MSSGIYEAFGGDTRTKEQQLADAKDKYAHYYAASGRNPLAFNVRATLFDIRCLERDLGVAQRFQHHGGERADWIF